MENNRRISEHLTTLGCKRLTDTNVKELIEEIYQDHKVKELSLDLKKIKVLEYNSSYIKVGVPILEGRQMLTVRPTNEYGSVHPVGALEDDWITKIFSVDKGMERVNKSIKVWRNVLDLYTTNLNEDIIHYHKHLMKDIEDRIMELRERCADLDSKVRDLSSDLDMYLE